MSTLDPLFAPRTVAVLGASFEPSGRAYAYVRALADSGYGGEILPVHPTDVEVCGRRCLPQLKDAKKEIDVVVVAVPPSDAVAAVREAAGAKAKAVILPEACGGAASSAAGQKARREVLAIARAAKMRLLGPRAGGVADPQMGVGLCALRGLPRERGGISIAAPDPAYFLLLAEELAVRGRGFARAIAYGEQLDIDVADALEFLGRDSRTEAILLVLDELRDGQRFLAIASEVALQKPVVALHVGETDVPGLYATAFRQCGLYPAHEAQELFDLGIALSTSQRNLPSSEAVGVVAAPGGLASVARTACARVGLTVSEWDGRTAKAFKSVVGEEAGAPLALPTGMAPSKYGPVLDAAYADSKVGGVFLLNAGADLPEFAEAAIEGRRRTGRCVVAMLAGAPNAAGVLQDGGIPVFPTPERAARAYAGLHRYRKLLEVQKRKGILARPKAQPVAPTGDAPFREREMREPEVLDLLRAIGVPAPEGVVVESLKTANPVLRKIGFPMTLRALPTRKVGKDGVKELSVEGVKTRKELDRGFLHLRKRFNRCPVYVGPAAPEGQVVPIVVQRDAVFGPVVVVSGPVGRVSRVCPLGRTEAELLLAEAGLAPEGKHHAGLVDLVVRLCQAACERESVAAITVHPRIVSDGTLWIGDASGVARER